MADSKENYWLNLGSERVNITFKIKICYFAIQIKQGFVQWKYLFQEIWQYNSNRIQCHVCHIYKEKKFNIYFDTLPTTSTLVQNECYFKKSNGKTTYPEKNKNTYNLDTANHSFFAQYLKFLKSICICMFHSQL